MATPEQRSATALAHPNIALVKYWGKRDPALNLPATGSVSITLDTLATTTRVTFDASLAADTVTFAAEPGTPAAAQRVTAALDLLRARAHVTDRAQVETVSNFPAAAGLASSASGFAALTVAAAAALGLDLSATTLSEFARRGSGSAARSIWGGFAEMGRGERDDGADAYATPLLGPGDWPLRVVVAITSRDRKHTGSTAGMELTRTTSPYYDAWVSSAPLDISAARQAIAARDFAALAAVSEHSCTKMHALMMSTTPALLYWTPATLACLHRIRGLRADGLATFFTVDAGPQVKAVCAPEDASAVAAALAEIPGVLDTRVVGLGSGAHLVKDSDMTPFPAFSPAGPSA